MFLDPTIIKHADTLAVDANTDHGAGYGATLSWPAGGGPGLGEQDCLVVRSVDIPRLEAAFIAAVRRPPQAP